MSALEASFASSSIGFSIRVLHSGGDELGAVIQSDRTQVTRQTEEIGKTASPRRELPFPTAAANTIEAILV